MLRTTKPPRCKVCRTRLDQLRPGQVVHESCVEEYVRRLRIKEAERQARAQRETTRKAKEANKTLRQLLSEAQDAFNEWVRLRDADTCCIACGDPFEANKPGGSMDAGHFRARSVAPQLRFHPDNVFGQHKDCNRPGGTVYAHFRAGVIARVGLARVEQLEANNTVKKWARDEVREIRDTHRALVREMKRAKETA